MSGAGNKPRALAAITLLALSLSIPPVHGAYMPVRRPHTGTDNFDFLFTLNRVQKYGFGGELVNRGRSDFAPSFKVSALYATGTKTWYPSLFVEQPLLPGDVLHAWVRASRLAEPYAFDDHTVTHGENTVAAIFAREDFLDYTEIRRVAGGLRIGPAFEQTVTLGISKERHRVMNRRTQKAGFFGDADDVFRLNPVSTEMEPTVITLRYDWQTPGGWDPWREGRWERKRNAAWFTWNGWFSDRDLGGDLDVSRQEVEGRLRLNPNRKIELRFRTAVGWTPYGKLNGTGFAIYPGREGPVINPPDEPSYRAGLGRLPPQWTFHAGGLGTLRSHDDKEFVGDHLILANAEYVFRTSRDVGLVLFTDVGRAWYENVEDVNGVDDMAWGAGVGVEFGRPKLRLQLAQDLRDFERSPRLTMRWEKAF